MRKLKLNNISIIGSILLMPIFLFPNDCSIIEKTIIKNGKNIKIHEMNCFPTQTLNRMQGYTEGLTKEELESYVIINEYATRTCSRASFHESFLHDDKTLSGSNGFSSSFHTGDDIYALDIFNYKNGKHITDDKAQAVADATIYMLGKNKDYGNFIILNHDNKYLSLYGHLKDIDENIISKENFQKLPDGKYEIKDNSFSFKLNSEDIILNVPTIIGKTILGTVGNTQNINYPNMPIHLHFSLRNFKTKKGIIPSFTNRLEDKTCKYPITKPIDTSLPIPTITSIKKCDEKIKINDLKGKLELEAKGEGQCIELIGSNFTTDSIVWWRVSDDKPFQALTNGLRVLENGQKLNVTFNDGGDDGKDYIWQFIITNERGVINRTKRLNILTNNKSNPISFKIVSSKTTSSSCNNKDIKFSDINNHKYKNEILYVKNNCIVNGYEPKNEICQSTTHCYKPNIEINRAEFTKIIIESLKVNTTGYIPQCFNDVPKGAWYEEYVCYAKKHSIIDGKDKVANKFAPDDNITFGEASKIIVLSLMKDKLDEKDKPKVNEKCKTNQCHWAEDFIEILDNNNINLSSFEKKNKTDKEYKYDANRNLTRGEMAYLIYSVLEGGK